MIAFLLPFGAGAAVAWAFDRDPMRTIFLGLCISITAMPVLGWSMRRPSRNVASSRSTSS